MKNNISELKLLNFYDDCVKNCLEKRLSSFFFDGKNPHSISHCKFDGLNRLLDYKIGIFEIFLEESNKKY
jgi:hypothetical protein